MQRVVDIHAVLFLFESYDICISLCTFLLTSCTHAVSSARREKRQGSTSGLYFLFLVSRRWLRQRGAGPFHISRYSVPSQLGPISSYQSPHFSLTSRVCGALNVLGKPCVSGTGKGVCRGRDRLLVVGGETKKAGKRRRPLCSSRLPRSLRPPFPPAPRTPLSPAYTEQNGGRSLLSPNARGLLS